jgi:hypothetical protein
MRTTDSVPPRRNDRRELLAIASLALNLVRFIVELIRS